MTMAAYNHNTIESKWQKRWEQDAIFSASDKPKADKKKYILDMFPYPSGAGLHVGHPEGYTATDIYCRYLRMQGYEVLHPMGWDAFGLPAENYAIKSGVHPKESTESNIKTFTRQIKSLGFSYDWSRELSTSNPDYYRWTQWLFLQLYKAGLAYKKAAPVNWCPSCQTVLANEQVVDGKCERCGTPVEQKNLEQWFFRITGAGKGGSYPERLLDHLEKLDWPEPIKAMQKNWIGKSEGAEIGFRVQDSELQNFNFVLLHGYTGTPGGIFFPWLKKELESKGYSVQIPTLPNPDKPAEEDQVGHVLKNCTFNENTILFGHSLGAVVAMKVAEKLKTKIAGLVLAGGFSSPKFKDKPRPFHDTFNWEFDFKKIKETAGFKKILSDRNDRAVRIEQGRFLHENLGGVLVETISQEQHFTAEEEPVILDSLVPSIKVFTTRPDTLFGATYIVLAPEHALVSELKGQIKNWDEVASYVKQAAGKSQLERTDLAKEKTGVELRGVKAINPGNGEEIPIWIADYVLAGYGTGAIMAVPAHDERDYEFAKKYDLSIRQVIMPRCADNTNPHQKGREVVEREATISIVHDPKSDTYLCLKWKHAPWTTFVTGGVESGEDVVESAKREIAEETGYTHISFVVHLGRTRSEFFASHKGINRVAHNTVLLFELHDDTRGKVADSEKAKHDVVWLSSDDIEKVGMQHAEFSIIWQWIRHKYFCAYTGDGVVINSGEFNGQDSEEAKWKITEKVGGKRTVQYKLRDWLISRQRYWGAPIPIIYCDTCGEQAVPEKDLPVELPDDVDFRPKGESPLARSKSFHKVKCPKCKKPARRESDTMDTFVDSSWYFLRYTDPNNQEEFADKKKIKAWLPVDTYVGGAEHAVLHLMYARFIYMVLYDLGFVDFSAQGGSALGGEEPFLKLRNQGLIMGPDGQKMSKSRGNVINPDEVIAQFGADTMRMYEMFMGPLEDAKPWDTNGIVGVRRFLERVWNGHAFVDTEYLNREQKLAVGRELAKTVKKAEHDIQSFGFNTAVSQCMIFINCVYKHERISAADWETFLKVLSPFAPHITNELWEMLGHKDVIEKEKWPEVDVLLLAQDETTYAVQVNGKLRGSIVVRAGADEGEVAKAAEALLNVAKYVEGREIAKTVFVKGKLINFVVEMGT